ncbi:MAG: hypothetical protein R3C32_11365 [Chloroflexota bacterium]
MRMLPQRVTVFIQILRSFFDYAMGGIGRGRVRAMVVALVWLLLTFGGAAPTAAARPDVATMATGASHASRSERAAMSAVQGNDLWPSRAPRAPPAVDRLVTP